MGNIDEDKRIIEYENILSKELSLKVLTDEELINLFIKIIKYLRHSRNDSLLGRSSKKFEENLKKYISFCKSIGFTNKEIIDNIEEFVSILHIFSDNFMNNYYLCSVLENKENTYRKEKLKKRAKDLMVDYKRTYARLKFMESIGYKPSWDNLLKKSDEEFAKLFVVDSYKKPYKIFSSSSELTREILLEKFPVDINYINFLCNNSFENKSGGYGKK